MNSDPSRRSIGMASLPKPTTTLRPAHRIEGLHSSKVLFVIRYHDTIVCLGDGDDDHVERASRRGLTTLPMMLVSLRERVTGRPCGPFHGGETDRDRPRRAESDAMRQGCRRALAVRPQSTCSLRREAPRPPAYLPTGAWRTSGSVRDRHPGQAFQSVPAGACRGEIDNFERRASANVPCCSYLFPFI